MTLMLMSTALWADETITVTANSSDISEGISLDPLSSDRLRHRIRYFRIGYLIAQLSLGYVISSDPFFTRLIHKD